MQYILSEEEYKELKNKQSHEIKLSKSKLQKLCTKIADNLILEEGWMKGKPWGCILSNKDEEWYCDNCPVEEICPKDYKSYSQ